MRRIDTPTAAEDLFGPGKDGFRDGNPALAILATRLNAAFFNAMQEEVAGVVEGAGLALDPDDNTQLFQAIQLLGGKILTKSVAGGVAVSLTTAESRNPIILLTGLLTANINLVMPTVGRQWIIANNTAGAFTVTVKTAAGSGVAVAQGTAQQLFCDGVNVALAGVTPPTQSIQGAFKNLTASATGTSATVTVAADEVMVEGPGNTFQTLRAVALAINSAGTGANGLDSAPGVPIAASTWYSVWVIYNPTTAAVAGLLSTSATAPTLPAGFTHKARLGWVRTDATGNKYPLAFTQFGRSAQYKVGAGGNVAALPLMASGVLGSVTVPTWSAVAVGGFTPPTASRICILTTAPSGTVILAPNTSYGGAGSTTNPPFGFGTSADTHLQTILNLESGDLFYASNSSSGRMRCVGWEDNL